VPHAIVRDLLQKLRKDEGLLDRWLPGADQAAGVFPLVISDTVGVPQLRVFLRQVIGPSNVAAAEKRFKIIASRTAPAESPAPPPLDAEAKVRRSRDKIIQMLTFFSNGSSVSIHSPLCVQCVFFIYFTLMQILNFPTLAPDSQRAQQLYAKLSRRRKKTAWSTVL
jgi:hypothetical protein